MAYSFRPRTGTRAVRCRPDTHELMQTGSEVTASEAIRILDSDVSRVADSDDSKVADSAKCLSESVQLSQEMVGTGHTPVAPNAASTTHTHNASPNHTHNAFPNLTIQSICQCHGQKSSL